MVERCIGSKVSLHAVLLFGSVSGCDKPFDDSANLVDRVFHLCCDAGVCGRVGGCDGGGTNHKAIRWEEGLAGLARSQFSVLAAMRMLVKLQDGL